MLHRAREIVVLNEFEQAEEMMGRTEVWHQLQRLVQLGANVRPFICRRSSVPSWLRRARLKFLVRIFIMCQKAFRASVQRFAEPSYCLIGVIAFRREQSQAR